MKIKNISNEIQAISGIPAFQPLEERIIDTELAKRLLLCPYIEEVKFKKAKVSKRNKIIT